MTHPDSVHPGPACEWKQLASAELQRLAAGHLYRERRVVRRLDATHVEIDGKVLLNFSSNDYLGLSHHPAVRAAVESSVKSGPFGSGAAPLISGYSPTHQSAERAIATWKNTEAAVLLPSGYQANFAAIQTAAAIGKLAGGVRFLVDKLAHASLIDAVRGTGEPFRIFPHNHMDKLRRRLHEANAGELQVVVTESIFSMDGDSADLHAIATLKNSYGFMLILDEAHATGVYGLAGTGLASELGIGHIVDASVLTLSKGLGGIGGAVGGSSVFCNALVNFGRAYLFSTAIPAAVAAAGEAAIGVLADEPWHQTRVRELARAARGELKACGFNLPPGDSPILPIILGTEVAAIEAAERLYKEGLLVLPVRPPTVPKGSSRLRVTLCSAHSDEDVSKLIGLLKDAISP